MYTNVDAQNYVIECIEASGLACAAEYDIEGITRDLYAEYETWDFIGTEPNSIPLFWEIVERWEL